MKQDNTKANHWTTDELLVCAVAYRRGGAELAGAALQLLGFNRSAGAIYDKMRKRGVKSA